MRPPEAPMPLRFDELLDAEIRRMSDKSVNTPPAQEQNLTLDEYKDEIVSQINIPTTEQRQRFIEAFEDDRTLIDYAQPGFKVVPLFMPHEHGYPEFDPQRVEMYGHLYYYVLDSRNVTARSDKLAYMDVVLPPEIIDNAVPFPENVGDIKQRAQFYTDFRKSVDNFLKMALVR